MAMRWNGKRMDFWEIVNTKKTDAYGGHWYAARIMAATVCYLRPPGPVVRSKHKECGPTWWWLGWCWLCNVLTDTRAQSILPAPAQALLCLHHTSNTPTGHRQWLPFQPAASTFVITMSVAILWTMNYSSFTYSMTFKYFWPHLNIFGGITHT